MINIWKIIVKDLISYNKSKGLLFWLLVFPVFLLMLTGDMGLQDKKMRVLVVSNESAQPSSKKIVDCLSEFSNLTINEQTEVTEDILGYIQKHRADMAIIWDQKKEIWSVYSLDHSGSQLFSMLARSFSSEIFSFSTGYLRSEMQEFPGFFVFSPPRFGKDLFNVPILISLVITLFPFVFASSSYLREREGGTLELLLVSPGVSWKHIYWGKLFLPIIITLVSISLQLIFAQYWFNFGIKTGMAGILGQQTLAMLSSAFLGLALSTFLRSSQDGFLMSAIYLLCLILLTGIIFPINQASFPIAAISKLFPITFSAPAFENWMSYGASIKFYVKDTLSLGIQCSVYFFLSVLGFHLEKKRF